MRRVRVLLGAAAVLLGAFVAGSVAGAMRPRATDAAALIQRAKAAAAREPFTGVVEVTWVDAQGTHSSRATLMGSAGSMQSGSVSVGANGYRDSSTGVWFAPVVGDPTTSPDPTEKYALSLSIGPAIDGRTTSSVEASLNGAVRERWIVDEATGMLLERDIYDAAGSLVRRLQVVDLTFGANATTPATTTPLGGERRVNATAVSSLPRSYAVPAAVSVGYKVVGRYKLDDGTVQVVYSDGLRDLSVFQQRGALDPSTLPAGGTTRDMDGINVWQLSTAGESMWVWQRNGVVFTMVTDAPSDELREVVDQLRPQQPNWWNRFRGWVKHWFN